MVEAQATVHIIEDDEIDREFLSFKLRAFGFDVAEYSSATSFLDALASLPPVGCLVLDLQMPGMNGLELQAEMRERSADFPIVFLSGMAKVADATQAMRNGALDLMEKPPDVDLLCQTLQRGLKLSEDALEAGSALRDIHSQLDKLTPREREVLPYVYQGWSLKEITSHFEFTFATAARHQNRILDKLKVANPTQLVRKLQAANIEITVDQPDA